MMTLPPALRFDIGILFLIHGLAAALTLLGAFLLIVWMIRHLSGPKLKELGLWLFGCGLVASVLTMALMALAGHSRGRGGMMDSSWGLGSGFNGGGMMGGSRGMMNWGDDSAESASGDQAATEEEEAAGKALWEKLQKKSITCASLQEDDFDSLGEYLMGQMMGDNHAAMNAMMAARMGEETETAMHVALGKRLSGCDATATVPAAGMMKK